MPTAVINSLRTDASATDGAEVASAFGLVFHLAVCHATDAAGGMQEEAAPHRLVPGHHTVSDWQLLWHAGGQ
jgi:hypothetical protein